MQAKPGEFRIHGRKPRKGEAGPKLDVFCGPEVSPTAAAYLRRQLLQPRWSVLNYFERDWQPEAALVEQLAERGYDLATLRFSLFLKGFGPPAKRPRLLAQVPGQLRVRWSWVEYDHTPDIVCCWRTPCRAQDKNLLLHVLSTPSLTEEQARAGQHGGFGGQFTRDVESFGFDIRTLRFSVWHKEAPGRAP